MFQNSKYFNLPSLKASGPNKFADLFKRVTSNRKFIKEIDGLRFVAILPVIIQHLSERILKYSPSEIASSWASTDVAFYASRGTMGVYLFFVISGFILCLPFAKSYLNKTKAIPFKTYFFKRISRLEPPYIFWMIFFFVVLVITSDGGFMELLPSLLASLFYVHNFAFGEYSIINPVAWSLEIELQFYVLAPFLAFIYFSVSKALLRRIVIVTLIIASPILQHFLGLNLMPWKASIIGQFQHFLLGFFLADLYLLNKKFFRQKNVVWDLIGVLSFLLMLFTWSDEWMKEILFSLASGFFFIAAFKSVFLNKALTSLYVVIIGGMCYTIYLIHLPLFELFISSTARFVVFENFSLQFLFNALIFIPLIIVISAFFFVVLEKPFMHKEWWKSNSFGLLPIFHFIKPSISGKRGIISTIIILVMLSFAGNILSQENVSTKSDFIPALLHNVEEKEETIELLPTEVLIDLAISRSPIIKSQQLKIENFNNDIKLINRKWLEYTSVGGTYFYGTSSYLDAIETVGLIDYSVTNRKNSISNMHVSARIPISEVFTRQTKKDKVINEIQIEQLNKEIIQNAIREAIISEQQIFTSKISILQIKSREVESLRLVSKVAEQYLREGNIEISEYSSAVSKLSKAEQEFASIKHEARLSYLALLEIVGQPIEKNVNAQ